MEILEKSLYVWTGKAKEKLPTMILPNGYGYLDYVEGLKNSLLEYSSFVTLPILSGQNGHSGCLNIEKGSEDLENIFHSITQRTNLICHCSSLMFINEINTDNFWEKIDKIILYSYLSNPIKHFERYKIKSQKYGVNINQIEEALLKYSDSRVYNRIPRPIYVIHPKTAMNRIRANKTELDKLSQNSNIVSIVEPEIGYEIAPEIQESKTSFITKKYFSKIL